MGKTEIVLRCILIVGGIALILIGAYEGIYREGDWLYVMLFFLGLLFILGGGRRDA